MSTLSGDFYSRSLRVTQHVNVILPDDSEDFWTEIDNDLKVLYLLHGLGSNADEWARFSMVEAFAKVYDFAVVMPDGNRSFYLDAPTGPRYFEWVSEELPELVHTWFRLPRDREHTFVCGESMGGYGALRMALAHPERFAGVAALSAVTDPAALAEHFSDLFWGDAEMRAVFGETGPDEEHSVESLARTAISQVGIDSIPRIIQMVGEDDPFCPYVRGLAEALARLGCRSTFESWPGRHDFLFWNGALDRALRMFSGLEVPSL